MTKPDKLPLAKAAANGGKDQGFSLIPQEKLLTLYSTMLKCRLLGQRAGLGLPGAVFGLGLGSEAAAAAATIGLNEEDIVIASPQNPLPGLIKGLPLVRILEGGGGRAMDHPAWNVFFRSGEVAALLTLATRVALESKVRSTGQIAVVFCGDHPQADASWEETLTFAGERELPILFVCQERKETGVVAQRDKSNGSVKDKSFGVPAISVDGNDAVAVYRVASESISRARLGRGPTVIDCRSFRVAGISAESLRKTKHGNLGSEQELHGGMSEDGLVNMERYLSRKGLFDQDFRDSVTAAFEAEIDAAPAMAQVLPKS